jgi:hypothetical protein
MADFLRETIEFFVAGDRGRSTAGTASASDLGGMLAWP